MKLADAREKAMTTSMTIEDFNALKKQGDAKEVFQKLAFDSYNKEYSLIADSILKAVKFHASGFAVDIATRFQDPSNKFEMSYKQKWVIAFAFINIKKELGKEIL